MAVAITYNTPITFGLPRPEYSKLIKLTGNSFLLLWQNYVDEYNLYCSVCIHNGSTISTYGTAVLITSNTYGYVNMNKISVNVLSDTKFVVFYPIDVWQPAGTLGFVCTISGTTITVGSQKTIFNLSGYAISVEVSTETVDSSNILYKVIYTGDYSYFEYIIKKLTISGNLISETYSSNQSYSLNLQFTSIKKLDTNLYLCVGNYSTDLSFQLFNSTTNTITQLATPIYSNFLLSKCEITILSTTQFILTYTNNGYNTVGMVVGTISGTTVTYGSIINPEPSVQNEYISNFSVNIFSPSIVVIFYSFYAGGSYYARSKIININGNVLTADAAVSIENYITSNSLISSINFSSTAFAGIYRNYTGIIFKYGTIPILGKKINGITCTKWNGIAISKYNGV